jgi:hypothetical protein
MTTKMKRPTILLMTALLLLTIIPAHLKASPEATPASQASTQSAESARANVLITRLNEINAMNKSTLAPSEKRELRKEVKGIKKDLRQMGSGVYISVGAIIIILLLILLL